MNRTIIKPSLLKSVAAKLIHLLVIFSYLTLTLAPNYALATQTTTETETRPRRQTLHLKSFPAPLEQPVPHYKIRLAAAEEPGHFTLNIRKKLGTDVTEFTPESVTPGKQRFLIEGLGNLEIQPNGLATLSRERLNTDLLSLSVRAPQGLTLSNFNFNKLKSKSLLTFQDYVTAQTTCLQGHNPQTLLLRVTQGSTFMAKDLMMNQGKAIVIGTLNLRQGNLQGQGSSYYIAPLGEIIGRLTKGGFGQLGNYGSVILPGSILRIQEGENKGRMVIQDLKIETEGQFINHGELEADTLSGQGSFINHADLKKLWHLKIRHFHNMAKEGSTFTPHLSHNASRSSTLTISPEVESFINGEGAKISISILNFLEPLTASHCPIFHNQGDVLVSSLLRSNRRNILNDGTMAIEDFTLEDTAILHNSLTGTLLLQQQAKKDRSPSIINRTKLGTIRNEGELHSYGALWAEGLNHFGTNQGSWTHWGFVFPNKGITKDNKAYTFNGQVKLTDGRFLPDEDKNEGNFIFTNHGNLTLDLAMDDTRSTLILNNHHKLKITTKEIWMPIELENYGQLILESGVCYPYQFKRFVNPGHIILASSTSTRSQQPLTQWSMYQQYGYLYLSSGCTPSFLDLSYPPQATEKPILQNTGTIDIQGDLHYNLTTPLGRTEILGDLRYPPLQANSRLLKNLAQVQTTAPIHLDLDTLEIEEDTDLSDLTGLSIVAKRGLIKATLKVYGDTSIDITEEDLQLGTDLAHFGQIISHNGKINLKAHKGKVIGEFMKLLARQDVWVQGQRLQLGGLLKAPANKAKHLGTTACSSFGGGPHHYDTQIFDLNSSEIISGGKIVLEAKEQSTTSNQTPLIPLALAGLQTYAKQGMELKTLGHANIRRCELQGEGNFLLNGKNFTIESAGQQQLFLHREDCPNGCGYSPTRYGNVFLSEPTYIRFMGNIILNAQEGTLSASELHAGGLIHDNVPGKLKKVSLVDQRGTEYHECKRSKRRRSYHIGYSHNFVQPAVEQSSQGILIQSGELEAFMRMSAPIITLRTGQSRLYNDSWERPTVEPTTYHINLNEFLQSRPQFQRLIKQANLFDDLSQVPAAEALPLIQSLNPNLPTPAMMQACLHPLTLQTAFGHAAGRLYLPQHLGVNLPRFILEQSLNLAHRVQMQQETERRRLIEAAEEPTVYIDRNAVTLRIPRSVVNSYQSVGDMESVIHDNRSTGDNIYSGTRSIAPGGITIESTEGSCLQQTPINKWDDGTSERQSPGPSAHFEAANAKITTTAAKDIGEIGTYKKGGTGIHNVAGGDILNLPAVVHDTAHSRDTKRVSITHAPSVSESGGDITNVAGRHITLQATQAEATGDYIADAGTGVSMPAARDVEHVEETRRSKGSLGGTKTRHEVTHRETNKVTTIKARKQIKISTRENNITTEAPVLKAGQGIHFSSPAGKLILKAVRDTYFHSVQKSSSNMAWQSFVNEGESLSTVRQGIYDPGEGEITIDAPEVSVEKRAEDLHKLDALFKALKNHDNVTWQGLEDTYESWHEEHHSLSPALGVVIGIGIGILTAGTGYGATVAGLLELGETAAATFVTGAVNAGISSLASQASISMINNQGDIGAVLKELSSEKSLRSLVTTMATAGLTKVGCQELKINLGSAEKPQSFIDRAKESLVRCNVSLLANTIINREDFHQALQSNLRATMADTLAGHAAAKIGVAYHSSDASGPQLDEVSHKLLHALVGAGMAAITKGDILAGSVGAVIGEIVAAKYRENLGEEYDPSKEDFDKLKERGVQLARLSAAFAAFLTGRDPNDAAMAAGNAARENAMQVTFEQYLEERQASARAAEDEEEDEEEATGVDDEELGLKAAIENSRKTYDREEEARQQQEDDEEGRIGILEDIFTPRTEAEWDTFRQARAELEENDPVTSKRDKGKERVYDREPEGAEAVPSSSSSSVNGSIADRVAETRHRQIDHLLGGAAEDEQFVFDNTTHNRSTGGSAETHSPFWQDVLEQTGFGRHGDRMLGIPHQELEGNRPTTYAQFKQKAWTAIKNKEALQAIKMAIEDGSNLYSSKIQTLRQTGEWEHLGAYQRGSLILDAIQLEMNRPLTGTGHLLLEAFKGTKWALQTAKAPLDPDYKTDIGRLIERAQAEGTWEQRYTPEAWASLLETNQQQLHRARVISGIAEGFTEGLLLPGKIIHTTLDAGQAGLQHLGCNWETARTIREVTNDALWLWPAARLSVAGLGLATSQRSASAILAKNRLGVPPSRTVQALDLSAAAASGALPQEAMLLSEGARNLLSKQAAAKNLAPPTTAAGNLKNTTTKTKTRGQGEKQITDAGLHKPVSLTPAELRKVQECTQARNRYLKEWRKTDLSGATQETKRLIKKTEEVVRTHFSPDDVAANLKENRGIVVMTRDKKTGQLKPANHIKEWKEASRGVKNHLETLKEEYRQLLQTPGTEKARALLQKNISDTSKLLDTYAKNIGKPNGG